jgi:hypothetical protein
MTASFLFLVLTLNLERQDVPASASAAGRRGYAQGSMLMTFAPAGTPYHRISPALGGHAVGLAANAGVFVTPALAVEGELVSGGTVSAPQNFSYFSREDYSVDNRDVLLNANVRWRPARTNHLEFVAGGGLAFATTRKRDIIETSSGSGPGGTTTTARPDRTQTARSLNLGGGVDAPIPLTARVALVPTFRLRWISRPEIGMSADSGVGKLGYQVGASIRARF